MKDRWLLPCVSFCQVFNLQRSSLRWPLSGSPTIKRIVDQSRQRLLNGMDSRKLRSGFPVVLATLALFVLSASVSAQNPQDQLKALSDQWFKIISTGEAKDALPVAQEQLALSEKSYGPDSLQTASAVRAVGLSYDGMRDQANALTFFHRALAIYEKLGGQRVEVCRLRYDLARNTKDADAALNLYETGLSCFETVAGLRSDETQRALGETVGAYRRHADRPESISRSEQLVQHWLPLVQSQLGPNDFLVADLLRLQITLLMARKEFEGAWVMRRRAIAIARNAQNGSLVTLDLIDEALNSAGQRPVDAEYMFYAAMRADMRSTAFGPNFPDAVADRTFLVKTRLANPGVPVPALQPRPSIEIDDAFKAEIQRAADEANRLRGARQFDAAISVDENMLSTIEERLGPLSLQGAYRLTSLGETYRRMNRPSAAEPYFARALVIYERLGYMGWGEACWGQAHLGQVYGMRADRDRAARWYATATDCFEKDQGPAFELVRWTVEQRIQVLREAHPEQAALLAREQESKTQQAAEWKRVLTEANTTRKPIASPNLSAMILRIPVAVPKVPAAKPEARKR